MKQEKARIEPSIDLDSSEPLGLSQVSAKPECLSRLLRKVGGEGGEAPLEIPVEPITTETIPRTARSSSSRHQTRRCAGVGFGRRLLSLPAARDNRRICRRWLPLIPRSGVLTRVGVAVVGPST